MARKEPFLTFQRGDGSVVLGLYMVAASAIPFGKFLLGMTWFPVADLGLALVLLAGGFGLFVVGLLKLLR